MISYLFSQFLTKIKSPATKIYSQKNVHINQLKYNENKIDSMIMFKSGETIVAKEEVYGTKKPIKFKILS